MVEGRINNANKENMKLNEKRCVPCEGGMKPMGAAEVERYLGELGNGWAVLDGVKIRKEFLFKNFKEALSFVNKVGEIAEEEGHHPDIHLVSYKKVIIEFSTHAISGLSENDFIMAAKIEKERG
mgnify:FL=1